MCLLKLSQQEPIRTIALTINAGSRDGGIRTPDNLLPKQALYLTELRPESGTVYRVVTIIGDWIVLVKL